MNEFWNFDFQNEGYFISDNEENEFKDFFPQPIDINNEIVQQDPNKNIDEIVPKVMDHSVIKNVAKVKKKKKEKIFLTNKEIKFQKDFYEILTNNKTETVYKQCVRNYHRKVYSFFSEKYGENQKYVSKITRDEFRSIEKYFKNHINEKNIILPTLQMLKNSGDINYSIDKLPYVKASIKK